MPCRVCEHASRRAIEAAAGKPNASVLEVAKRFGVNLTSLRKHLAAHARAAPIATDSPPKAPLPPSPRRRAGRRAPSPPAPPVDVVEEAPATSRSGEISARTIANPKTAREKVERLVDSLQALLDEVSEPRRRARRDGDDEGEGEGDEAIPLGAKLAVLRAMVQPLRLLGTFTGEIGASESTVSASPFYKRVRAAVIDALRTHPEAARAVIDALERLEGGSTDLEAAAE